MTLPEYKTTAGNRLNLPGVSSCDERFCVQNTNEEECLAYAQALLSSGFELYDKNEMPAGDNYIKRMNIAFSFKGEENCVFVFWDASQHTVFVVKTAPVSLPALKNADTSSGKCGKCTLSQIALAAGGMSYVVKLADGAFLVIDGGKTCDGDAENLYKFLKANVDDGNKPRIAMWFFTHAHSDHIGLATRFLKKYNDDVEILAVAHQFPDFDKVSLPYEPQEEKETMLELCRIIRESFPESSVYYMHTGQRYSFCGTVLEVLSSMDNTYPSLYYSLNDTSVITRLTFDSGSSVLLLADSTHVLSRQLFHTYGAYLKSDFMQMAHHGFIGGDIDLYKTVDPDVCLWPVKPECFNGTLLGQKYQWCLGEGGLEYNAWIRDSAVKPRLHYDHSETVSFEI